MSHQVFGVLAIALTFAMLLRGWGAPSGVSVACGILGMVLAALVALSGQGQVVAPGARLPAPVETAPPVEGIQAAPEAASGARAFR